MKDKSAVISLPLVNHQDHVASCRRAAINRRTAYQHLHCNIHFNSNYLEEKRNFYHPACELQAIHHTHHVHIHGYYKNCFGICMFTLTRDELKRQARKYQSIWYTVSLLRTTVTSVHNCEEAACYRTRILWVFSCVQNKGNIIVALPFTMPYGINNRLKNVT